MFHVCNASNNYATYNTVVVMAFVLFHIFIVTLTAGASLEYRNM